jgi:hypothetical protein
MVLAQRPPLSRGFDPIGCPTEPLVSYQGLPTTPWVDAGRPNPRPEGDRASEHRSLLTAPAAPARPAQACRRARRRQGRWAPLRDGLRPSLTAAARDACGSSGRDEETAANRTKKHDHAHHQGATHGGARTQPKPLRFHSPRRGGRVGRVSAADSDERLRLTARAAEVIQLASIPRNREPFSQLRPF